MDIVVAILGWIAWALLSVLGLAWTIVWFLISGWVSTLLQIAVLVAAVFFLKYGWQRAPLELWKRGRAFSLFIWGWVRAGEPQGGATREVVRETVRVVRVKEMGDINVSTLMSLLMLGGLLMVATLT